MKHILMTWKSGPANNAIRDRDPIQFEDFLVMPFLVGQSERSVSRRRRRCDRAGRR
jgi:hypothetical protein